MPGQGADPTPPPTSKLRAPGTARRGAEQAVAGVSPPSRGGRGQGCPPEKMSGSRFLRTLGNQRCRLSRICMKPSASSPCCRPPTWRGRGEGGGGGVVRAGSVCVCVCLVGGGAWSVAEGARGARRRGALQRSMQRAPGQAAGTRAPAWHSSADQARRVLPAAASTHHYQTSTSPGLLPTRMGKRGSKLVTSSQGTPEKRSRT